MSSCPVCGGKQWSALLERPGQPIYQHPVPADAVVSPPHAVDLAWVACADCAHAWQPKFDAGLLEAIYRSHYYTPAPDGIAVQFRDDFLLALERFGLLRAADSLLEIGASNGDALERIRHRTGASHACAYEPNVENAVLARQRGLEVRESFFGRKTAQEQKRPAQLVYARHVIEHIFDFEDFFVGLSIATTPDANLVLETPSLDYHAARRQTIPFHIEHVHVFSLRSLARVAQLHGWGLTHDEVTADGNLIAAFRRVGTSTTRDASKIERPQLSGLQAAVTERRERLRRLVEGRPLVFWGAGSAGVGMAETLGREPDFWTDGNPNKVGKKFVGLGRTIIAPEQAFAAARAQAREPVLIVASSFAREILPRVRALGWEGDVLDLAGVRL